MNPFEKLYKAEGSKPEQKLEGSGERALSELEKEIEEARQQMEELEKKSERGEYVDDQEVRRLHQRIQELKKAKSDIELGGM